MLSLAERQADRRKRKAENAEGSTQTPSFDIDGNEIPPNDNPLAGIGLENPLHPNTKENEAAGWGSPKTDVKPPVVKPNTDKTADAKDETNANGKAVP